MIDGGLSRIFQDRLPHFHWQRVETGGTGQGIPDLNYCYRGAEGWLELKATTGWTAGLRPEQAGWIARRARAGGRCFVAVRRAAPAGPRRGCRSDDLWLVRGAGVLTLHKSGLRAAQAEGSVCGIWVGGPARWDWEAVAGHLTQNCRARCGI